MDIIDWPIAIKKKRSFEKLQKRYIVVYIGYKSRKVSAKDTG
jgi:hypothetical protein